MSLRSILVALLLATTPALAATHRATWVWDNSVTQDAGRRAALLRFCHERRIDTLFLHAPADHLRERAAQFRALLVAAHAQGIRIDALDGEATWAHEPARAEAFLAAVRGFNDAAALDQKFDGVQLDVEPYDTPEWKESPAKVAGELLAMLDAVHAGAGGIRVTLAVPPWYGEIGLPDGSLLAETITRTDEIALMAYTDQKKGLGPECRPALDFAAQEGKQVWVGISAQFYDTDMDPARPAKPQVERLIKSAERMFAGESSLRGIAVHDYEHWRTQYSGKR
jgi:hypothetical protein